MQWRRARTRALPRSASPRVLSGARTPLRCANANAPAQGTEELTDGAVEAVLEEVRPFLAMAGGSIELISLVPSGIAPTCTLKMSGSGSALTSVKVEIQQRLKRKLPALVNIMWE